MSESRRCLVTGAAGFIGSHLSELLLQRGHTVTAVDNLATGRRRNLAHLDPNERFAFVEADICDAEKMASAMRGVDWVFHLAGSPTSSRRFSSRCCTTAPTSTAPPSFWRRRGMPA